MWSGMRMSLKWKMDAATRMMTRGLAAQLKAEDEQEDADYKAWQATLPKGKAGEWMEVDGSNIPKRAMEWF